MTENRDIARLRSLIRKDSRAELAIGTADSDPETGLGGGGEIRIPYSARSAHMHVIGRTRSGKSRFLADLIRQDILHGSGLCLIDPHGELYDLTINWLAQMPRRLNSRKIHAVRFTNKATSFRYNPLRIDDKDDAYTVSRNVTDSINRIYGGRSATETPLIGYVLDVVCTILALRQLPLAAATFFLQNTDLDRDIREKISEGAPDARYRQLGLELSRLPPREFRETVAGAQRRIHDFLGNPAIARIFSVTDNTADLRRMMDERHVLLLNTSDEGGLIDFSGLRTIGMMLTNNLFAAARKRPSADKPAPFMLYVDEVQNYVSVDIESILSQAAKRGLYLTLSHQFLDQLRVDPLIYSGVMNGTLLKAVFQTTMEDADSFIDELFADRIDPERVKEKLKSPHVVGHEIALLKNASAGSSHGMSATKANSQSKGSARGESRSHMSSFAESATDSDGVTVTRGTTTTYGNASTTGEGRYIPDGLGPMSAGHMENTSLTESTSISEMAAESYAQASSRSSSTSTGHAQGISSSESETDTISNAQGIDSHETRSVGESEALKPVIEWFSTQAYSLEEQRYLLKRTLAFQKERHGYLAVRREGTIGFTTRGVPDPLRIPKGEAILMERIIHESPWISLASEIPNIDEHPVLQSIMKQQGIRDVAHEPESFFEPDEPS